MDLSTLKPAKGATHSEKRIARGQGSGHGGTSTRGHKGDGSRSGHKTKRNFEGGQMPLQMRLPKRGFKSIYRIDYVGINLSSLQHAVDKFNALDFNMDSMKKLSMVKKSDKVKILGNGELNSKISVSVHAISATAKEKIEALGGSVQLIK